MNIGGTTMTAIDTFNGAYDARMNQLGAAADGQANTGSVTDAIAGSAPEVLMQSSAYVMKESQRVQESMINMLL